MDGTRLPMMKSILKQKGVKKLYNLAGGMKGYLAYQKRKVVYNSTKE